MADLAHLAVANDAPHASAKARASSSLLSLRAGHASAFDDILGARQEVERERPEPRRSPDERRREPEPDVREPRGQTDRRARDVRADRAAPPDRPERPERPAPAGRDDTVAAREKPAPAERDAEAGSRTGDDADIAAGDGDGDTSETAGAVSSQAAAGDPTAIGTGPEGSAGESADEFGDLIGADDEAVLVPDVTTGSETATAAAETEALTTGAETGRADAPSVGVAPLPGAGAVSADATAGDAGGGRIGEAASLQIGRGQAGTAQGGQGQTGQGQTNPGQSGQPQTGSEQGTGAKSAEGGAVESGKPKSAEGRAPDASAIRTAASGAAEAARGRASTPQTSFAAELGERSGPRGPSTPANPTHPLAGQSDASSPVFRTAATTLNGTAPSLPVRAIALHIASRAADGANSFQIRLDPPELGRIDVRLDISRDGQVAAQLTVDRPETLDALQRDQRGLERTLQNAGLDTSDGGLSFSLRQDGDADSEDRDGGGHGAGGLKEDAEDVTDRLAQDGRPRLLGLSALDIRV